MKVLWHSNAPWAPTGYGSQTGLFTPLIQAAGHDVAISAFWGLGGRAIDWHGMTVYPGGEDHDRWLPANAMHHGDQDLSSVQVITLMDVWVLNSPHLSKLNLAAWCPVDHMPTPPLVAEFFKRSGATPIAMSRFGEDMFKAAGLEPLYVPHGVDTNVLRPVDRSELRSSLGIAQDAFVVGMVAANQGNAPARKAFPAAFTAFAIFHAQHPDSVLYLHSMIDGGINLAYWLDLCGVPLDAVKITPQDAIYRGLPYEAMATIFSNLDVLLSPSYGEGFGIPILEAQACGTPVIVNDFSAMPELCGAGWKTSGEMVVHEAQGAWWQAPSIGSIVDCLEAAYDNASEMRDDAREFALGYDTRKVMAEHWTPVLAELEARMGPKALTPKALAA